MPENTIGTQIAFLREKYDLTQDELASKLGYSKQTVSNWETGLKNPRMGAIQKIADYFGVTKSFIIDGIESSTTDDLTNIYEKLEPARKKIVIDIAKDQLNEQQNKEKTAKFNSLEEYRKKVPNAIDTLAAHSPDRKKKYTDQEIENMKDILDSMIEEHINNNNK